METRFSSFSRMTRLSFIALAAASIAAAQFNTAVQPILKQICSPCHNEKLFPSLTFGGQGGGIHKVAHVQIA